MYIIFLHINRACLLSTYTDGSNNPNPNPNPGTPDAMVSSVVVRPVVVKGPNPPIRTPMITGVCP